MLCPFCLAHVRFRRERQGNQGAVVYRCPTCREPVPAMYVQDYRRYPPVVLSAIGFRGHGKTVYFAALFYTLKKLSPARYWPKFSSMGLDESSLETVYGSVTMLQSGALPDSTPKSFPRPTMLRLAGVPQQHDCTLQCYDTAGECFERPTQLVQFAGFVRRAQTALFLISMPDLADDNAAQQMHHLLNTYVVGMRQLEARAQAQHLIVVFTKADEMTALCAPPWNDLRRPLSTGAIGNPAAPQDALREMENISAQLEEFVRQEVQAIDFLHLARQHFNSVTFSLVSALGSRPQGQHLPVEIVPRRVLDPLLWTMHKSFPARRQRWQAWWNRLAVAR